jgi:L-fuculose-phosphate aldolase
MTDNLWQLKKEMADIGHRIWQRGFCAGNEGNHSMRISEDRVLCTPTGISKGFLKPEDMCIVDMDGEMAEPNMVGRTRSSEVKIHIAIYKHRRDIKAVVHSHPPHATAFAMANMPLPEGIHPEAEVFLGRVPLAPYATPSKQELADSIIPLIKPETNTVIMGNHGTVNFSGSLQDAYYKLEILDAYCRILLLARQLGQVKPLSNQQMHDLLEVKQNFGMADPRLACAADGCVGGEVNQPFFASFDVRPTTAACNCNGDVAQTTNRNQDDGIEQLVQAITNEIVARMA